MGTKCIIHKKDGVTQWLTRQTRNRVTHTKAPIVSLIKKLCPRCPAVVGPGNEFERAGQAKLRVAQ